MRVIVKQYPEDWDHLTVYPIGDIHYGAKECMVDRFKEYVDKIKDDPFGVVILLGDAVNNGIKSSVTDVYEETCTPRQQKLDMGDILRPIGSKVACSVRGNHEFRTFRESGIDISEDIARDIGAGDTYAGDAAVVKISVGKKKNGKQAPYMIYASHGSGGGALLGSGASRQDGYQMAMEGIDISCTGHTHKPIKIPSARFFFDPHNNKVIRRNTLIYVCTSWLDYGGYAERAQMRPTAFKPETIELSGISKEWK